MTETGDYGGGVKIPAILNEGNLTLSTSLEQAGGSVTAPTWTYAAPIALGDYVALDIDTNNTLAKTRGVPVVVGVTAAATSIVGRVRSTPKWVGPAGLAASRTESSAWSAMLTAREYRMATVEFFVINIHKALSDGSGTAIDPGAPLNWDLSSDGYVDAGTSASGAGAMHYCAAAATEILVSVGFYSFSAGDADQLGIEVVA